MTEQKQENKQINQENMQEAPEIPMRSKIIAVLKWSFMLFALLIGSFLFARGIIAPVIEDIEESGVSPYQKIQELLFIILSSIVILYAVFYIFGKKKRIKCLERLFIGSVFLYVWVPLIVLIIMIIMRYPKREIPLFYRELLESVLYFCRLFWLTFFSIVVLHALLSVFCEKARKRAFFIIYFALGTLWAVNAWIASCILDNNNYGPYRSVRVGAYTVVPVTGLKRKKKSKVVDAEVKNGKTKERK